MICTYRHTKPFLLSGERSGSGASSSWNAIQPMCTINTNDLERYKSFIRFVQHWCVAKSLTFLNYFIHTHTFNCANQNTKIQHWWSLMEPYSARWRVPSPVVCSIGLCENLYRTLKRLKALIATIVTSLCNTRVFIWLGLKHIVRDRLRGGTCLSCWPITTEPGQLTNQSRLGSGFRQRAKRGAAAQAVWEE